MTTEVRSKKRGCLIAVIVLLALFALVVYFGIPWPARTVAEVCGTYVLDCDLVQEELTLRPDGTFTQVVRIKATGEGACSDGQWVFDTQTHTLNFDDNFMDTLVWPDVVNPAYAQRHRGGAWNVPARYWWGHLMLGAIDDWPPYKKVR